MPMLEEGLNRLFWPPLVKEAVITSTHPGYRYEMFTNYAELDGYFSKECGEAWKSQPWAQFWFNQHAETKRKDREEHATGIRKRAARNSGDALFNVAVEVLQKSPGISVRKLTYALSRQGIAVSKSTVAKYIKRFKEEQEHGETI